MTVAAMRKYLEKEFPVHKGTESMDMPANGYHIFISEGIEPPIKADFFYTEPFIFPAIEEDGFANCRPKRDSRNEVGSDWKSNPSTERLLGCP